MNIRNICTLLLALFASACSPRNSYYAANPNLLFRLVADDNCGYCKTVSFSEGDNYVRKIKLGSVVARAQDIEYISRNATDNTKVLFAFRESSQRRVLNATRIISGKPVALLSGDQVITIFVVTEPFSAGAQLDLFGPTDLLFKQITGPRLQ